MITKVCPEVGIILRTINIDLVRSFSIAFGLAFGIAFTEVIFFKK